MTAIQESPLTDQPTEQPGDQVPVEEMLQTAMEDLGRLTQEKAFLRTQVRLLARRVAELEAQLGERET